MFFFIGELVKKYIHVEVEGSSAQGIIYMYQTRRNRNRKSYFFFLSFLNLYKLILIIDFFIIFTDLTAH